MVCDKDVSVCVCDKVECANKCKACHAKRRWMLPSAMSATQNQDQCRQVPRLPRETKVDVAKCHPCHAKWRGVTGGQVRHQSQPSPISSTPATQNEGRCPQVSRLPRERTVDVAKCYACHAKCRGVTWRHGGPSAPPEPAQSHKYHACKRR